MNVKRILIFHQLLNHFFVLLLVSLFESFSSFNKCVAVGYVLFQPLDFRIYRLNCCKISFHCDLNFLKFVFNKCLVTFVFTLFYVHFKHVLKHSFQFICCLIKFITTLLFQVNDVLLHLLIKIKQGGSFLN